ncbi:hypothetical protein SAMN05421852_102248 [Thermoflavimicrobium dichotomicum]|uniref:Uncharacterized protein n=1 Tax=Thermoflavimicrobium dichotomicum TaxID=46223 RepID=A0A1I3LM33_9BACL|nr:hypothetical protein SAMN05421852_102248 [Thermoflavimicrobium dichotomicum]
MFNMKLISSKPLEKISLQPYKARDYDPELDDETSVISDICRGKAIFINLYNDFIHLGKHLCYDLINHMLLGFSKNG